MVQISSPVRSVIKSIQIIAVSINPNQGTVSVAISAIVIAKTFLSFSGGLDTAGGYGATVTATINTTTNLFVTTSSPNAGSPVAGYIFVTEFY